MILLHCAIKEKDSLNYRSVCSLLTAVPCSIHIFCINLCHLCTESGRARFQPLMMYKNQVLLDSLTMLMKDPSLL